MWKLFTLLLTGAFHHSGVYGCVPGEPDPTVDEKVTFAHVVVQGIVTKRFQDKGRLPDQYPVEFKVQCVYKDRGKVVSQLLNITNAGANPGRCFVAELQENESYVVFLRELGARYEVNAKEIPVRDAASTSKITSTCGLSVVDIYPQGITEATSDRKCQKITTRPCPSTTPYVPTRRTKHPPKTHKPEVTKITTSVTDTAKSRTSTESDKTASITTAPDRNVSTPTITRYSGNTGNILNLSIYHNILMVFFVFTNLPL